MQVIDSIGGYRDEESTEFALVSSHSSRGTKEIITNVFDFHKITVYPQW